MMAAGKERMYRKLLPLVERLARIRVLVVGDAMTDHYVVGSVSRISPEAPVPILNVREEFDRVGGAANVAGNVTSLGATATLVAFTGGLGGRLDADGERLAERCRVRRVDAEFIPALPCTVRKTRFLAGRQQMLRVDWEQVPGAGGPAIAPEALSRRQALVERLLPAHDVVLVSDYAKGMVDAGLMAQLLASGRPVVIDPRPRNAELYRGAALITPNRKEAREMLGGSVDGLADAELGARLAERLQANVLVTLGEDGMCLCVRGEAPFSIPTRAMEVFDVTGAGDTVAAAFALAMGAGATLPEAACLANAAAGVVVGHVGAAAVAPDELRAALVAGA